MSTTQRVSRRIHKTNRKRLSVRLRQGLANSGSFAREAAHGLSSGLRSALPYLGVMLVFLAVPFLVMNIYRYFTSSEHFAVTSLQVSGNAHISEEDIWRIAGIAPGVNLLMLDTDKAKADLELHPWVRAVHIEEDLPDKVVIRIEERAPVAVAALPDLWLVDDRGVAFKQVKSDEIGDLPVITGVSREELEGEDTVDEAERWLREATRIAGYYNDHPVARTHALGEIHVDPLFGFTVVTREEAIEVRVGAIAAQAELEERLDRLGHVLADAEARSARLHFVRLDNARDPGRVAVKMHYVVGANDRVDPARASGERGSATVEDDEKIGDSGENWGVVNELGRRPAPSAVNHILP